MYNHLFGEAEQHVSTSVIPPNKENSHPATMKETRNDQMYGYKELRKER